MAPTKNKDLDLVRAEEREHRILTAIDEAPSLKKAVHLRQEPTLPYNDRSTYNTAYGSKPKLVDKSSINSAIKKVASKAPYTGTYHNLTGLMYPEYPLLEPFTLLDTEVYVKQAIARKLALVRKAGWEIVSDTENNKKNIAYIRNRLSAMEYVSGQSTTAFFIGILESLLLCSNCFLLKVRDEAGSGGVKTVKNENRTPIAAYQIIPPHQLLPYLKRGKIAFWRRFFETGSPYEDISTDDIVHLKWDEKDGHIFGTPRTVAVRDDIFALRRLEENIELLFINYLFPLFHVKVGTEKEPCFYGANGESEVTLVKYAIENMPKEGVFVTDERVEVDSVGANGQALDPEDQLVHWKNRIFTGLGVSSVDMGETDTANSSTADNVSQNLKDLVKSDLDEFADMIRLQIFKEFFLEASYSLSIHDAVANIELRFHEIDLDSKIKKENHIIQLWLNNLLDEDEARTRIQMDRMTPAQEKKTHYWMHIRDLAIVTAKAKVSAAGGGGGSSAAAKPAGGMSQNQETPANQHGTLLGPAKSKASREIFGEIVSDKLTIARDKLLSEGKDLLAMLPSGETYWSAETNIAVNDAIEEFNNKFSDNSSENSYTKKLRMTQDKIKALISLIPDSEMLTVLLSSGVGLEEDDENE